jgi:hypothetical protein
MHNTTNDESDYIKAIPNRNHTMHSMDSVTLTFCWEVSNNLSWCRAPICDAQADFYYCRAFTIFLLWGTVPDEKWSLWSATGLASSHTLGYKSCRTYGHILLFHVRLPQPSPCINIDGQSPEDMQSVQICFVGCPHTRIILQIEDKTFSKCLLIIIKIILRSQTFYIWEMTKKRLATLQGTTHSVVDGRCWHLQVHMQAVQRTKLLFASQGSAELSYFKPSSVWTAHHESEWQILWTRNQHKIIQS